jgi:uncharacterized protein (TIGR03000 family)
MRSFCSSVALALTPLVLLGTTPRQAEAQGRRPAMAPPNRPMMMHPFRPGLRHFQPMIMFGYSPGAGSSSMSPMSYGMSSSYPMPSGGYGSSQMPYGGSSSYSLSSSPSPQAKQLAKVPKVPSADDVEVSGPLDKPPPHRAIVRVRLPRTWADVSIDGRKIDTVGKTRYYVTPELSGERTFEVTATWNDKGKTGRLQGQVTVNAGQVRTLDFTSRD